MLYRMYNKQLPDKQEQYENCDERFLLGTPNDFLTEIKMKFTWKDQKVLRYCELGAQSLYRSFIHRYDQNPTPLWKYSNKEWTWA